MAANEVNIQVNVATKDSEKQVKGLGRTFEQLKKPILAASVAMAGFAASGILAGRSLIATAVRAGAGSRELWKLEEASFELRRTLGELLLKTLGPLIEKLANLLNTINNANPRLLKFAVIAGLIMVAVASVVAPILAVIAILPAFVGGIGILTVAFGGLSIAMGPITLAILGIAAVIGASLFLWRNWDTIMEGVRGGLSGLDSMLGGLLTTMGLLNTETEDSNSKSTKWLLRLFAISLALPQVGNAVLGVLGAIKLVQLFMTEDGPWDKFKKKTIDTWNAITAFFTNNPIALVWLLPPPLIPAIAPVAVLVKWIFGDDEEGEVEAGTGLRARIEGETEGIKPIWETFWDWMNLKMTEGKKKLAKIWNEFLVDLKLKGKAMWEDISQNTFVKFFITALALALKVGQLILTGQWSELWTLFKTIGSDMWDDIQQMIFSKLASIIKRINDFIRFWNSLEFRVPKIPLPGGGFIGGFTVGTPNVGEFAGFAREAGTGRLGLAGNGGGGIAAATTARGITINNDMSGAQIVGIEDFESRMLEVVRNAFLAGGFRDVVRQ